MSAVLILCSEWYDIHSYRYTTALGRAVTVATAVDDAGGVVPVPLVLLLLVLGVLCC